MVTHIKQTGCHGPEDLELICKPSVMDNNGIGRTIETPVDDRNSLVRKYMNINYSSKRPTDSDSRVHAKSRAGQTQKQLQKTQPQVEGASPHRWQTWCNA